jgi:hypothetical protein
LLLYFPGTADDLNLTELTSALNDALAKRAAQLGFAAAVLAYRSFDLNLLYPDRLDAKERCVWAATPSSAVAQLCGNQGPLASLSTQVDCSKGIAVAGHSQGGMIAAMAANYDSRVCAAFTQGTGAGYDPSPACESDIFSCAWASALFPHLADPAVVIAQRGGFDSFVMGSSNQRVLSSDRIRAVVGDIDPFFHAPADGGTTTAEDVGLRLNNLLGLSCSAASPASCARTVNNGSGWFIVGGQQLAPCAPGTACTAVAPASHAGHCFFSDGDSPGCTNSMGLEEEFIPDPNYFGAELHNGWSLDEHLLWLLDQVNHCAAAPSPDAGAPDAGGPAPVPPPPLEPPPTDTPPRHGCGCASGEGALSWFAVLAGLWLIHRACQRVR